jgi:hypothetical protein
MKDGERSTEDVGWDKLAFGECRPTNLGND